MSPLHPPLVPPSSLSSPVLPAEVKESSEGIDVGSTGHADGKEGAQDEAKLEHRVEQLDGDDDGDYDDEDDDEDDDDDDIVFQLGGLPGSYGG